MDEGEFRAGFRANQLPWKVVYFFSPPKLFGRRGLETLLPLNHLPEQPSTRPKAVLA